MIKNIKKPLLICLLFFIAYSVLSIIRHLHYGSFGFDLGVIDQVVWDYSKFQSPITTIHFYPFQSILADHVELIFIPLSVFYWVWSNPITLLIMQTACVCSSGVAIFLLAKEKKLKPLLSYSLLFSYLAFYGIQNALWFDVHSASFAAAFLAWLVYFLEKKNTRWIVISFLLAILSKENVASLTFLIAFVYFVKTKSKISLILMTASAGYLLFIFGVYFPYLTSEGYRYASDTGLLSNINHLQSFYDTPDKRQVILNTLAWFGFLPLLNPIYLIPTLGDLFNYFVVANHLPAAQGIFMHYRITLAPLMVWATIYTIAKYKLLNNKYVAIYLILITLFFQYFLHLPLSYLAKSWFWTEPPSVKNINEMLTYLPKAASVVSQNNITPHISHRDNIFTLWPEKKSFNLNSPCGQPDCDWFRWAGKPEYLIIDTSAEWDIRHLLANREDYVKGLENLEKEGVIKKYRQKENAVIYRVVKNP